MATPVSLTIPEILSNVMGHLTEEENRFSTYNVCRLWSDISKDHVWKRVDKPRRLFNVFVPLKPGSGVFSRVPRLSDWTSFRPIAFRVRSMTCGSVGSFTGELANDLYRCNFVPKPVLPNLRHLSWSIPPGGRLAVNGAVHWLFAHAGLRSCELNTVGSRFVTSRTYSFGMFACDISQLAPNIRALRMSVCDLQAGHLPLFETDLVELLTALSGLEAVYLPPCAMTQRVMRALADLPHLQTVLPYPTFIYAGEEPSHDNPIRASSDLLQPLLHRAPAGPAEGFPCLTALQLCVPLLDAIDLLRAGYAFVPQLRELRVRAIAPSTNAQVNAFLRALTAHAHSVRYLLLFLDPVFLPNDGLDAEDEQRGESLDAYALEPLQQAFQLLACHIRHVKPVTMSEQELLAIIRPLNLLELSLAPSPAWEIDDDGTTSPPSSFTLGTIARIIDTLPELEDLGLYVDFTEGVPPQTDLSFERYHALRTLDLGTSRLPEFSTHAPSPCSQDPLEKDAEEQLERIAIFLHNITRSTYDGGHIHHFRDGLDTQRDWGLGSPEYNDSSELAAEVSVGWDAVFDAMYLLFDSW